MSTSDRLFDEQEIGALLKRAAALQGAEGPTPPAGLTLAELEAVATEAGIDARYVHAALAEQATHRPERRFYLLGGPTSLHLERVVHGEVVEETWEEITAAARAAFRGIGTTSQAGATREWTQRGRRRQTQVSATTRQGQTRLRVESQYPREAALFFAPMVALGIVLGFNVPLALGASPFDAFGVALLTMVLVLAAARSAFGTFSRSQRRQAERLLAEAERALQAPPLPAAPPPVAPPLSLDEAEPLPEASATPPRTRTRG